jgi:hypothetical protein
MELQADCFAGIWANQANRTRQILEQGDLESALNAAAAMGTTGCKNNRKATWCRKLRTAARATHSLVSARLSGGVCANVIPSPGNITGNLCLRRTKKPLGVYGLPRLHR